MANGRGKRKTHSSTVQEQRRSDWKLKLRLTRMWQGLNCNAERTGMNYIFVDALGGRIHAWSPARYIQQPENSIVEGETYDVHNFVVRQYADMTMFRCLRNDIFIEFNRITEFLVTRGVDYIPQHVFEFTDLSALTDAAGEDKYLIDVVGILQEFHPLSKLTNRYRQEIPYIEFTITDMFTSAKVVFYNEMAEYFDQAIHDAVQHPVIIIISSCRAKFFTDELKLTNFPATRYFINPNHEAVDDLGNAIRLAQWRNDH